MTWSAKTLGMSAPMEEKLREIKDALEFGREDETYKFCFAIGFTQGLSLPAEAEVGKRETKWATSSFDEGDELKSLLTAKYGNDEDLLKRLVETAESGIIAVHDLVSNHFVTQVQEVLENVKSKN